MFVQMALGILLFLIYSIVAEENQTVVNKTRRNFARRAKKPSAKSQAPPAHSHADGGCGGGMCAKDAPIKMRHTDEV